MDLLPSLGRELEVWTYISLVYTPSLLFCHRKKLTDEDIEIADKGLQRVRDDIAERRKGIERLEASQV